MANKILYGQIHQREDFERVIRLKGTQTRVTQKGKEWFLITATWRVAGIYETKEAAIKGYLNGRRYGFEGRFRLHNIETENHGRCSMAKCKAIFNSFKK